MGQEMMETHWNKTVQAYLSNSLCDNLVGVSQSLYRFHHNQSIGKNGGIPDVPFCSHAENVYTTTHSLVTSAIAYCLSKAYLSLNSDKLNHLRLSALAHDLAPEIKTTFEEKCGKLYSVINADMLSPTDEIERVLYYSHLLASNRGCPDKLACIDWKVSLIMGGATKIKGYVFESAKLPEIRGASALLEWVTQRKVREFFSAAPECLFRAAGGEILAIAPAGEGNQIADDIEALYTFGTLTAHNTVVAKDYSLLELQYGLEPCALNFKKFQEDFKSASEEEKLLLKSYFGWKDNTDIGQAFEERKGFGELTALLAKEFDARRNLTPELHSGRADKLMPNYELVPIARRCDSCQKRPANVFSNVPDEMYLCQSCMRKRLMGLHAKQDLDSKARRRLKRVATQIGWCVPEEEADWLSQFVAFLQESGMEQEYTKPEHSKGFKGNIKKDVYSANDLHEIGKFSSPSGYIGMIYADGNSVGALVEKINSPAETMQFSLRLYEATKSAVFRGIAKHLKPIEIKRRDRGTEGTKKVWIHPFEIITVGGDDLILLVPGSKAIELALTIAQLLERPYFDAEIYHQSTENGKKNPDQAHRYNYDSDIGITNPIDAYKNVQPKVSLSGGVVVAADTSPIYIVSRLAEELQKSAKTYVNNLKHKYGYCGGTLDFMFMKSVPTLASGIKEYRSEYLQLPNKDEQRNLTLRPYTLCELEILLQQIKGLKKHGFPRTQLSALNQSLFGARGTGELWYLYQRERLKHHKELLKQLEVLWKLTPVWRKTSSADEPTEYSTVLYDLIEMYDFVEKPQD